MYRHIETMRKKHSTKIEKGRDGKLEKNYNDKQLRIYVGTAIENRSDSYGHEKNVKRKRER